jgi:hypothetical protein
MAARWVTGVKEPLFHLFQVIETDKHHHVLRVDKDELVYIKTISWDDAQTLKETVAWMDVALNRETLLQLTMDKYFLNAADTPGPPLWRYRAATSNCQHFVMRCLEGSKLLTPEIAFFVEDNASKVAQSMLEGTVAERIANVVTDSKAFITRWLGEE